jgi:hypothetical protein
MNLISKVKNTSQSQIYVRRLFGDGSAFNWELNNLIQIMLGAFQVKQFVIKVPLNCTASCNKKMQRKLFRG